MNEAVAGLSHSDSSKTSATLQEGLLFVERNLKERRLNSKCSYMDTHFLLRTSNYCERLFLRLKTHSQVEELVFVLFSLSNKCFCTRTSIFEN